MVLGDLGSIKKRQKEEKKKTSCYGIYGGTMVHHNAKSSCRSHNFWQKSSFEETYHLNLQVRSLAEVVLNSYLHQTCFDLVILWQPESHPKFKTPFPRFSVNRMNLPVVPLNRIVCWIQFVESETSVFVIVA